MICLLLVSYISYSLSLSVLMSDLISANFYMTASNMNYTCVCVGGFLLLELLWWIVAGKKYSRRMEKVREEEKNASQAVVVDLVGKS